MKHVKLLLFLSFFIVTLFGMSNQSQRAYSPKTCALMEAQRSLQDLTQDVTFLQEKNTYLEIELSYYKFCTNKYAQRIKTYARNNIVTSFSYIAIGVGLKYLWDFFRH